MFPAVLRPNSPKVGWKYGQAPSVPSGKNQRSEKVRTGLELLEKEDILGFCCFFFYSFLKLLERKASEEKQKTGNTPLLFFILWGAKKEMEPMMEPPAEAPADVVPVGGNAGHRDH